MKVNNPTVATIGPAIGSTTCRNRWWTLAPSITAASSISCGMVRMYPKKSSVLKTICPPVRTSTTAPRLFKSPRFCTTA